ncbi:ABC transporter ATP-binding protein [Cypionkella sp.]|uniref:ABC transporter ATP-binding protein n=1 Tax=Cypionkella sp. TaxID=2811411 RepID=UPI002758F5AE|nr:ABC transporter ATP-binding protein/permease [Cypionkella sp.]
MIPSRLAKWSAAFAKRSLLWRLLSESLLENGGRYFAAITAMVLVAVSTALSAWIMGEIVQAMTHPEDRLRVFLVAGAVVAIFMIKGLSSFAQTVLMARAGNRIVAEKQSELFRRLLKQSIGFFNNTESSMVLMQVTQSAQMARGVIDIIVTGFVRDLLTLFGLIFVMFYQQPVLSLICLVIGPAALFGVRLILVQVRAIMAQEMMGMAEIIRVVQEASVGARVIKAFALDRVMADRMDVAVRQVESRANKMIRLESATSPLMDTLTGVAIGAVVVLSSSNLFGQEAGTPGQLMSFVTAFIMAYEPAKRLSRMRVSIESGMVGVQMMYTLLDAPQTMVEADDAVAIPEGKGHLRLDKVSFSYTGATSVVNEITIDCPAGKTTALVGPSGGGKSTLLNLMLRLYDPSSGSVSIDGLDLQKASFDSLRRTVAYVGQDTFLFSANVIENLRVARQDATDAEVIEAAKVAHADEFICQLPNGYQTQIGENGAFLSGGQRQRLAIARAVLRRAPILLLDEATSALDSHSETLVRDALERVTTGVTTIVVAHRLSTVLRADQICYIEAGRVEESGSLDALLAKGGKFRALYDQQFQERS